MKYRLLFAGLLFLVLNVIVVPQSIDESWKVYDDTEVAVYNITMDENDLQFMIDNPHSDSMHASSVHIKNAIIDETIDLVGIRIRGNTSRESKKKSFKLSFNTFQKGRKFYSLEKINLNGGHNDPSIIRSKLCLDFFNDIGMISSRASHAAVYINEKYYGLYISIEHIDENFIAKNYGDDSGNLWKCLYGADLTNLNVDNRNAYTLKTNKELNDFSELDTLTKVINNTQLDDFEDIIEDYFNVTGFLKYQAVNIIVGSWDDYSVLSNNYYLYYDPSTDIINWIPYDYDNTFGIDWLGFDWANTNPYALGSLMKQPRPLYNRLIQIPRYRNLLSHFVEFYFNKYFQSEYFDEHLDSLKTLIKPFALIDTFKSLDWGFTNDDFNNSYSTTNFVIDPHVKYSIKEYNLLRKTSLDTQIEYLDSDPIVYDVNLSNAVQILNEVIEINASIFSNSPIKSVTANLTLEDGTIENIPFTFNPINETFRVEESDNWTAFLNPIENNKRSVLKIEIQDNNGGVVSYPKNGILIYSTNEVTNELLLSELMSSNSTTITDNYGEYEDWLEIYNPKDTVVNLSGKYLTDKMDNLTKWQFPENVKIEPHQYILIWCDEDQEQAGPHINFKLNSGGEFIAIVDNDGVTIVDSVTAPALNEDESYARQNNEGDWVITNLSTPGESNIVTNITDENFDRYTYRLDAYPNPFNPSTTIEYEIAKPMEIELKIYDVLGREIWSVNKERKESGSYMIQWNGRNMEGRELASGIYIVNINGESFSKTIKLMLLR